MAPDEKAIDGNSKTGESHELVAEYILARKGGNQFRDNTHRRKQHDVDGRVRVEPEKMLEENRVAAQSWIEDAHAKDTLQSYEQDGDGYHGSPQYHDEARGVV